MKVLILHHHFNTPYTGGAIRSYYLAKALVDRGIKTTVITTHNEEVSKTENIDGIHIHYLPIAYDNTFGFYKRSFSFLRYIIQVIRKAKDLRDYDVCYTISVPLTIGIVSLWLRRSLKMPYIFEVGDLWPDAPIQLGFIKNPVLKNILYKLEKTVYQHSKFVVALSPDIQKRIASKVPEKKISLITNMADTEFFNLERKDQELERKFNVENKFVVSYIGALGFANGLESILNCAKESAKAGLPVHFLICGEGAMMETLQGMKASQNITNLSFLAFRNRDGVKQIMNVTDAVFICYQPAPILETGSPNKYFDGLAAGKLIVINFGGWIKDEIEREQCGFSFKANDPLAFVKEISSFVNDKSNLAKKQLAARTLAEKKYSRQMLSETFALSIQS